MLVKAILKKIRRLFFKKKKLSAGWIVNVVQDLKAFHSIEIEEELIQSIVQQIKQEIDHDVRKRISKSTGEL